MQSDTYTMSMRKKGGAEQIVARGVSATRTLMIALTLRSSDYRADMLDAIAEFGSRFLSTPRRLWAGRIETDADFARRHRDGEA
jgi:hypothetical protein